MKFPLRKSLHSDQNLILIIQTTTTKPFIAHLICKNLQYCCVLLNFVCQLLKAIICFQSLRSFVVDDDDYLF